MHTIPRSLLLLLLSRILCLLLTLLLALPPALAHSAQVRNPVRKTAPSAAKTKAVPGRTAKPSSGKVQKTPVKPPAASAKKVTAKAVKPPAAKTGTTRQSGKTAARTSTQQPFARPPAEAAYFKGALLYNVTANRIVFSRHDRTPVPPASLTKILSIYVTLDAMKAKKISPRTLVKISPKAASTGGSRMGLHAGDRVRLDDLLRGMAVASGNDASVAVAEYIGGSEAGFVRMMNRKARQIGMTGSVFHNAHGLPAKGQVTTAKDMLALARSYLRAYPGNLAKYHTHRANIYKGSVVSNANPLLGNFKGADGLKTGFVNASGYNLIATAHRGRVRLVGVFLGAPTSSIRARKATAIMEAGFGKLACPLPPPPRKKT